MLKKNATHQEVVDAIDKAFAADIRCTLDDKDHVTAFECLTVAGANYVLKNNILGVKYDIVLANCGLTLETLWNEENEL